MSKIESIGVPAHNILFNRVGSKKEAHLSGMANIIGTILKVEGSIHLSGQGKIEGAAIAGGDSLHLSGQGLVYYGQPFCVAASPTPDPDPEYPVPEDL